MHAFIIMHVCVCVCVCVSEREREREREGGRERMPIKNYECFCLLCYTLDVETTP